MRGPQARVPPQTPLPQSVPSLLSSSCALSLLSFLEGWGRKEKQPLLNVLSRRYDKWTHYHLFIHYGALFVSVNQLLPTWQLFLAVSSPIPTFSIHLDILFLVPYIWFLVIIQNSLCHLNVASKGTPLTPPIKITRSKSLDTATNLIRTMKIF